MKKTILFLSTIIIVYVGCQERSPSKYNYQSPDKLDDGIEVGTLSDVNIDSVLLAEAVDSIYQEVYKEIHSLLIYKDEKLVFEEYFAGHQFKYDTTNHHGKLVNFDRSTLHPVMSVTKSVTSTCIGIAVDLGFIESINQSIFDFLPEYDHFKKNGKEKITIEHLLRMSSGLDWNEWALPYGNPKNDVIQMAISDDPVEFYLNKPLIDEPGTSFKYSGGCNILLGKILEHATKMTIDEFSGKYLFGPLGIEPYYWAQYESGTIDGAGGLQLTPRAMVKIGATFLNKGIWGGKRIISEEWVDKSTVSYPGNSWMNNWDDYWGMRGYGYMWWTHTFTRGAQRIDMYYAAGWGGQFVMVIPALNTVVVFTEGNYLSYRPAFEILKKYIIPAIN